MQRSLLKNYISEVLKEEATADDIYGKYLFGFQRKIPPESPERSTPEEKYLAHIMKDAFTSGGSAMRAIKKTDLKQLVKLRDQGKYVDVLAVPPSANRAWRYISLDRDEMPDSFHPGVDKETIKATNLFKDPQVYRGSLMMPLHKYNINSWTISPEAVPKIVDQFTGSYSGNIKNLVLIFSVDLNSERDKFLLNPENTKVVNPYYNWQAEIWQVAPVVCDKWIIWRPLYASKEDNARALDVLSW